MTFGHTAEKNTIVGLCALCSYSYLSIFVHLFVFLFGVCWTEAYSTASLCVSVCGRECRVKASNVNGKKCVWKLPTHTCMTVYALDPILCVHLYVYVYVCIYICSVCVSKSSSTCSLTSLPSRRGDMRIEPSASPPAGPMAKQPVTRSSCLGMEKMIPRRSKWKATTIRKDEGWRKNESDVRRGRCKMVLFSEATRLNFFSLTDSAVPASSKHRPDRVADLTWVCIMLPCQDCQKHSRKSQGNMTSLTSSRA